jgi:predicted XRE-type DNA-binding protein
VARKQIIWIDSSENAGKERERIMIKGENYTISSDNIFADHGRPNPEERLMRVELLYYIATEIKRRNLSPTQAADQLDIKPSQVDLVLQAKASNFSLEQVLQMVTRLGVDLTLSGQPAMHEQGHVTLSTLPQFA